MGLYTLEVELLISIKNILLEMETKLCRFYKKHKLTASLSLSSSSFSLFTSISVLISETKKPISNITHVNNLALEKMGIDFIVSSYLISFQFSFWQTKSNYLLM